MPSRRTVLRGIGALGIGGAMLRPGLASADPDPWARAAYISARVRRPRFAPRWFDITRFGAVGDGVTDCTAAIRRAIRACHRAGGGHVVVPDGQFLTGAIHLRSGVDLHVTGRVLFSQNPAHYLPVVLTRFEGVELYNYSPLIYAFGQRDIAVTGTGVLDGQSDLEHWWPWCGAAKFGWQPGEPRQTEARTALSAQAEQGIPVDQRRYGDGGYLRPSFIEPYRCRDVLIEGVTCLFDTGDDCIAIKSGRNADGRRVNVPSEDILVEGCTMRAGHGGVTIGSEMTGGARNVFVRDCEMSSPDLDIVLRFKTNSVRGGFIEGFHARDLTIGEVGGSVIDINFFYEEGPGHGFNPVVGDIHVQDVTVRTANRALNLRGYADDHIRGITLRGVDFGTTAQRSVVEHVDDLVLDNVFENGAEMDV